MPWELSIHLIDVGQGDSTLVVARNTDPGGLQRSMLIDAGISACGSVVDDYLKRRNLEDLDHIVNTHYDDDHRAGLQSLLLADNLSDLADALAVVGGDNASGADKFEVAAAVAAAVCSAALGNYGTRAGRATAAAQIGRDAVRADDTKAKAASRGAIAGDNLGAPKHVPSLIPTQGTRHRAAAAAGLAAVASMKFGRGGDDLITDIARAIVDTLKTGMASKEARFWTGRRYSTTHVMDLGVATQPNGWLEAVTAEFTISKDRVRAAYVDRVRDTPALQSEVLWNSGPNAILPPAGAPTVHVVSCDGEAWQGAAFAPFPIALAAGNSSSIGLLIRFNSFAYYTAGDLATVGEDPLMNAIMTEDMPVLGGGVRPAPDRIASFKCSHHGAAGSTSEDFLDDAEAATALISCGNNGAYQHPSEAVVNRLYLDMSVNSFYLTNCAFETPAIVASWDNDQLTMPDNNTFVAGDNNLTNLAPDRDRGDIRLGVTQAQSLAAKGAGRRYWIRYWEPWLQPSAGFRNVVVDY
jgi:beta-lactamase superfamily II metal-dependent hydrolase